MVAKSRQSRKQKLFTRMTAAELARATERFDRAPLPDDAGKPMSPSQAAEWSDRKGRGRPRTGLGAVNVLISIERGLLEQADAYAKSHGVGRSALIATALDLMMNASPSLPKKVG